MNDARSAETQPQGLSLRGLGVGLATLALLLLGLAVRSGIVYGLVVLAVIFIPLEKLLALHPRRILRARWRTDVVHLVVNQVFSGVGVIAFAVIGVIALRWAVPAGLQDAVAAQPGWSQLIEALLVADFAGYWAHRATHQVPLLWRFHKVHHSIEEMDWLAAGRLHPLDQSFTRACSAVPLYLLGFSRATFGGWLIVLTLSAIFIHANVRLRFGALRWVITTPEYHHWHHTAEAAGVNTNFAGQLPLLDLLFGTAHLPDRWPHRYGIDEPTPAGYLAQLVWPFRHTETPQQVAGSVASAAADATRSCPGVVD
ncbi:MAG: sterol desaturase family protein [Acidimicrobiales bacterium]